MVPWFTYNYVYLGRFTLSPAGGIGRGLWEGSWQGRWAGRAHNDLTKIAEVTPDRAELDARAVELDARAVELTTRADAIADIVDAAVHGGGDIGYAQDALRRVETWAAASHAPFLRVQLSYVRPLLADGEAAEPLFQSALRGELVGWPCFRGRLLLAYGVWLRRQRRVADSRAPLRAAAEAFDALGFATMSERARQELRASGETSRRRVPEAWDQLSPQELAIARMASDGMTNREIGQRLYLSHRTIGSHLYRIFPKLGITSRSQLRGALDSTAPSEGATGDST